MSTLAVVIASIREESMNRWLKAWQPQLGNVPVYLIEDGSPNGSKMTLPRSGYKNFNHWTWKGIEGDLGPDSWIIPRYSSAIKSFGFMKAYADGHDYIWTLDDDCFPDPAYTYDYVPAMVSCLEATQGTDSWWNTIESVGLYPRGYPYGTRQVKQPTMIHHGLWSGVPDLDGITALEHHSLRLKPSFDVERVPTGQMFPMCGMNLAFNAKLAPAMYFGLQGSLRTHELGSFSGTDPLPFDRFDDIWAGLFAKKVCDHLGYAVTSGGPSIVHTKESDPTQRVIKEGPGIAAHEILWPKVASRVIPQGVSTVKSCYSEMAFVVDSAAGDLPFPDYWKKLAEAMHIWTEQF